MMQRRFVKLSFQNDVSSLSSRALLTFQRLRGRFHRRQAAREAPRHRLKVTRAVDLTNHHARIGEDDFCKHQPNGSPGCPVSDPDFCLAGDDGVFAGPAVIADALGFSSRPSRYALGMDEDC